MDRRPVSSWRIGAIWRMFLAITLTSALRLDRTAAGSDSVQFDVESLIACRDVTPNDFALSNPLERLVSARFPVSVLSRLKGDRSLEQVWIRIESPDGTLRVIDYAPRTVMSTDVVGAVQVQGESEQSREWNFQLQGQSPGVLSGEAKGMDRQHEQSQYHLERLPSLELGAASGTVQRGRGVYFKLRSGPRISLEGEQGLSIVFRVPQAWRGDRVYVHCEAIGSEPAFAGFGSESSRWGARSFVVALYLEGDAASRNTAAEYVHAEGLLRTRFLRWQGIERDQANAWRELLKPARSKRTNWAAQLIYARSNEPPSIPAGLSGELRDAVARFHVAQDALRQLASSLPLSPASR